MGLTTSAIQPPQPAMQEPTAWLSLPNASEYEDLFTKLLERAQRGRPLFEREWYGYVLMYSGHHWTIFDRVRGQWRRKRGPKWFPRPVTNRCAEHVDDNVSALTRNPPELSWIPCDDNPKSIAAADVADRIDELIVEETGRFRNARLKAGWAAITGDVFVESGIDKSWDHGTVFVPHQECADCGYVGSNKDLHEGCPQCESTNIMDAKERVGMACPTCGEFPYNPDRDAQFIHGPCPLCAEQAEQEQAAAGGMVDPETGLVAPAPPPVIPTLKPIYGETPLGTIAPKGKIWERVRSPFEVYYDLRTVREFSKEGGLRWCILREMVDAEEVQDQYPGMPIEEESTSQSSGGSVSLQYLESVSLMAGMIDPQERNLSSTTGASGQGGRVLREVLYHLPTKKYPEGLTVIRINGSLIAEVRPLAFHDNDGQPFISVVHIPFKKQPGRVPGRTFMNDIAPLNRTRNETEAMMILAERRMANPVNLIPQGTMDRNPTGEPGENWYYKHISAGSGRPPMPTRLPGVAPDLYFDRRLAGLDQQMERLAGSFAIAHGEAPKGITAASALALLGERQERAVSPQVQSWEQAHEQIARQQMHIFREYCTEERTKALQDSLSKWSFESFSNADVDGNFTVKVEIGSATPKSNAQMRATLEAEMRIPGFLNLADPGVARRVHQIMGSTTVIQGLDAFTRDAQKQQDLWLRQYTGEEGGEPMTPRPLIDNHMIHAAEHIKFALGDKWREIEKKAMAGDTQCALLMQEFYLDLQTHLQAIAPPPEAGGPGGEGGQEGGGKKTGRPEGTGKVLSAGRQDVPPGERAISEPGTGMGGEGLR